jgi:hypothetical protein
VVEWTGARSATYVVRQLPSTGWRALSLSSYASTSVDAVFGPPRLAGAIGIVGTGFLVQPSVEASDRVRGTSMNG